MSRKSGWDQAPTKVELIGFAKKSAEGAVRYAQGIIIPGDDDSHLSDHAHFRSSSVSDPGDAVAGLPVKKK